VNPVPELATDVMEAVKTRTLFPETWLWLSHSKGIRQGVPGLIRV
jgi:hypothetical protein